MSVQHPLLVKNMTPCKGSLFTYSSIKGTSNADRRKDPDLGWVLAYKLQCLGVIAKGSKEPDNYFK